MRRISIAVVVLALGCNAPPPTSVSPAPPPPKPAAPSPAKEAVVTTTPRDVHSHAIPEEARVKHLALDLTVDFAARVMRGAAMLWIEKAPHAQKIVLDARGLNVELCYDQNGKDLPFTLSPEEGITGSALAIGLRDDTTRVVVKYQTKPEAQALQWLTKEETAGKKHPFLFTQGQAILTRTWIPVQDSPGIRFTYEAQIRVDDGLVAAMGAQPLGAPEGKKEGAQRIFTFEMPQKIPAYLIALAVGDLAFKPIGTRTGVWAEPSVVDGAAEEFSDVEKMVASVESMYGFYRWQRYDILVLPASFPFGGMENPRLTFLSPTGIAGDKSLVSLIAHELAHSWSGNLVTNATWGDFWLNEGVTTYIEGRIVEQLFGKEREDVEEVLGWRDLQDEMAEWGKGDPRGKLAQTLAATDDPDDAVTSVPYVKGASFLRALERAAGRPAMDAFLKKYFDEHAFASMTTDGFLALLARDLPASSSVPVEEWVRGAGIPASFTPPVSARLQKIDADVAKLAQGADLSTVDVASYAALERVHFLKNLPRKQDAAHLKALDHALGLSSSRNAEVVFEWLRLVIANHYEPALPQLSKYLSSIGRRKLVLPLYEELVETTWGKPFAQKTFAAARAGYHPLTIEGVEEALAGKHPVP